MRDLSALTRDLTLPPEVGVWSFYHWTASEVQCMFATNSHNFNRMFPTRGKYLNKD